MLACFLAREEFCLEEVKFLLGKTMPKNWKQRQLRSIEMIGLSTLQVGLWVFINHETN